MAKSGAFNSVVEAFVLMRMVGCFVSRAGKSVFRRARTWWPSCTISPVCSEFEMKVSGGNSPTSGSVQRERASKPIVALLDICIRGWYSKCRLPVVGKRGGAICGVARVVDMVSDNKGRLSLSSECISLKTIGASTGLRFFI